MASVSLNTQKWNDKVEIVNDIYKIMKNLIENKEWDRLSTLYNGMSISTGMGSIPFSDSIGVESWLTSHYDMPWRGEFNQNAYAGLFKGLHDLHLGGKRSTRRHRSRRQRTRRHKK
jgi:hypothetical protein